MIEVENEVRIEDLLQLYFEQDEEKPTNSKVKADEAMKVLSEQAQMLRSYFSIGIEGERLVGLPGVTDLIEIQLDWLPTFIYKLAFEVDYTEEIDCFDQVSQLIGYLYS